MLFEFYKIFGRVKKSESEYNIKVIYPIIIIIIMQEAKRILGVLFLSLKNGPN